MTAISFNSRAAVKLGTVDLSRVYCGATLLWSKAVGLPFTLTSWATTPGPAWTVLSGQFKSTTLGGQSDALMGSSTVAKSVALHNTITATNLTMAARVNVDGAGNFVALLLRASGTSYYAGEYADGGAGMSSFMRISKVVNGVRTQLGSWGVPRVITTQFMFSAIGDTLTVTRGAVTHSVQDTTFTSGQIGVLATSGDGFNDLRVTAA